MAVKIRLMRFGRRHRPFFRINAVESRTPRDGKIIEKLGHYDPIEKDAQKQIVLNRERIQYWLDKGAIPSDTVSQILLRHGIKNKYAEETIARRGRARTVARAKGRHFTKTERIAAQKQAEAAKEKTKADAEAKAKAEKQAEEKAKQTAEQAVAKPKAETKAEEKAKPQAETKPEEKAQVKLAEKKTEEVEEKKEPQAKVEAEPAAQPEQEEARSEQEEKTGEQTPTNEKQQ